MASKDFEALALPDMVADYEADLARVRDLLVQLDRKIEAGEVPSDQLPHVRQARSEIVATLEEREVVLRKARAAFCVPRSIAVAPSVRPRARRAPRQSARRSRVTAARGDPPRESDEDDADPPLERICEWPGCDARSASARSDSRFCNKHRNAAKQKAYRERQAEKRDRAARVEFEAQRQTVAEIRAQIQTAAQRRQEIWSEELLNANGNRSALRAELNEIEAELASRWVELRLAREPETTPDAATRVRYTLPAAALTRDQRRLQALLSANGARSRHGKAA